MLNQSSSLPFIKVTPSTYIKSLLDFAGRRIGCQQALEASFHEVIDHDASAGQTVQKATAPLLIWPRTICSQLRPSKNDYAI